MIWYAAVVTGIFLVGHTGAVFNDIEVVRSSLHVKWDLRPDEIPPDGEWDKSSLEFIDYGGSCASIYAVIKNGDDSEAMAGPVQYEVYWAQNGNAKNGEVVHTGTIKPLGPGESITLEYTPDKSGNYKFKAYQRSGHPGTGELWSDGPEGIVCEDSLDQANQENQENSDSPKEIPGENANENGNPADAGLGDGVDSGGSVDEDSPAEEGGSTDGEGSGNDGEIEESGTDEADSKVNEETGGTMGDEGSGSEGTLEGNDASSAEDKSGEASESGQS